MGPEEPQEKHTAEQVTQVTPLLQAHHLRGLRNGLSSCRWGRVPRGDMLEWCVHCFPAAIALAFVCFFEDSSQAGEGGVFGVLVLSVSLHLIRFLMKH